MNTPFEFIPAAEELKKSQCEYRSTLLEDFIILNKSVIELALERLQSGSPSTLLSKKTLTLVPGDTEFNILSLFANLMKSKGYESEVLINRVTTGRRGSWTEIVGVQIKLPKEE